MMKIVTVCCVSASVVFLTAGLCLAQAQPAPGQRPPNPNRPGAAARNVNQEDVYAQRLQRVFRALQNIELTDPQKQAIEALREEYTGKVKPLADEVKSKSRDLKARQDNDPDDKVGIQQMQQAVRDVSDKLTALEGELIDKVRAVLKDDQVQEFNQALGPQANRGIVNIIDRLLPIPLQALQQLDLTDQQRQDVRKLMHDYRDAVEKVRQEYNDKINEKLTPEQRDQLKKLQDELAPGAGQGRGQGAQNRQDRPARANRRQQGDGAAEPPADQPPPPPPPAPAK